MENLILFLLTALPLMGSPGPANISATAVGSAFGVRGGLRYVLGLSVGTFAVLLVVASGISTVVLAVPGAKPAMTGIAAAYILYLAWKIATAPPSSPAEAGETDAARPRFTGGLLLAVANPKAFAAIGAVYSSGSLVPGDLAADTAAKIAALGLLTAVIPPAWLLFGAAFSALSLPAGGERALNLGLAAVLVVSMAGALAI